MRIGDPQALAIESEILEAYDRPGLLGLGFFVLYIGGFRYGVHEPNATLLANSYDEIQRRSAGRGTHTASFASFPDAAAIADAYRSVVYSDHPPTDVLGVPSEAFESAIDLHQIVWAPDGDEAFDDGSYVLQFDFQDSARLVAFRCGDDWLPDPETLRDVWLSDEEYYGTLQKWTMKFNEEWASLPKRSP